SYLYLGDRWAGAWGGRVNDSQYVWLPLQFPTNTTMTMSWSDQVLIDTATGVIQGVGGGSSSINLVARHSGKCADVSDESTADRAAIIQWRCTGGANQQWQVFDVGGGYVQLRARHSGKCLDVSSGSTADGARLLQWPCGSGANQQWRFQDAGGGYWQLVARHSGKCLDVTGASTADGATLQQWSCTGGTNQQWLRRAA
ncbi:MAG: RICIN domain-containing protein, partial [Micromonosporaceae bacterium]|nr:RICIN domain-containing protein [Micromonosporaceae bacterium]